jgi:hypothetical protein
MKSRFVQKQTTYFFYKRHEIDEVQKITKNKHQ